jgi:hypothetical protein
MNSLWQSLRSLFNGSLPPRQAKYPPFPVRKVTDEAHAANPHYICKVCDGDSLGKELHKLCFHSPSCSYLSTDQQTLAFHTVIDILMMCG